MHTETSLADKLRVDAARLGIKVAPEQEATLSEATAGLVNALLALAFVWGIFAAVEGARYLFAWLSIRGHTYAVVGAGCASFGLYLGYNLRSQRPRLFGILQILAGISLGAFFGHRLLAPEANRFEQIAGLIGALFIVAEGAKIFRDRD